MGCGTQCLDSSSAPSPFNQGLIPNCSSALTNKETPTQVLERFVKFKPHLVLQADLFSKTFALGVFLAFGGLASF